MYGVGRLAIGISLSVFFTILVIVLFKRITSKYKVPFVSDIVAEV